MEELDINITATGTKYHYKKGTWIYHRLDGPAIEWYNGDKSWFVDGYLHRLDGPAEVWARGNAWYINGKQIHCRTQEEFERLIKLKYFW